ncbi:endolytic transglycosylase MltG [Virgibacillus sp. 179-BFC.A HS]|uniref:Endolytic murein transglycosylase n=1 Tax=Tigheibacillus jepli TaxID=3035914 RepID=A0ABU5CGP7_9BACI|nr:endolytic transglycosylase MltG [Virgibacillus sp. 179-BFC.A HS]MDY0405498.1 endolytic transglycosylase MltG [Virgibacillus sp. 179-BFC.A HS]
MAGNKDKKNAYKKNMLQRSEEARTVRKIVSIILISLVLILIVGGISGYMYIKSALKPLDADSQKKIKVEIPMGSSTSQIGQVLENDGVIKDGRVFRFYVKFKNESNFQAGKYTFQPSMTLDEIVASLKKGKVMQEAIYKITIPEGKTMKQIAQIYAKKTPMKEKDFLKKVNDKKYVQSLIDEYPSILTKDILSKDIKSPLEGYLFAATYNLYDENPSVDKIIKMMLNKTEEIVTPYLADIKEKDLTIHEAITLASLVENEASSKKQRKKIASVFYNRMADGMKLQTDPTVQYALGKHKSKVLLKDLEVDSPYNTYKIKGLPVGPISNFSEDSLTAVVHPAKTDYKYFLHDEDGNIYYAKTFDEHLKLKKKHIK